MNTTEKVICSLLSHSLFGLPVTLPINIDWDDVLHEAQQQAVLGLIANSVPENIQSQWKPFFFQNVANFTRNLYAQQQLTELFSKAGIPIVILKGAAAAIYYPIPYERTMGDIDFLVPQDRYQEARKMMEKNGYHYFTEDDPDARHTEYIKGGNLFEIHHHFSHDDLDIESYMTNGLRKTETAKIGKYSFSMLPPLANGLVLLDHVRYHLKSGLGLRQVIDWMMYVEKVLDDTFWNTEFEIAVRNLGIELFATTTTRMCQMYFGLKEGITWCQNADEGLCTQLLENLFTSGNFGVKQGTGNKVETVLTAFKREGLFHYLQKAGKSNWKAYKKNPKLEPLCWVYQIGRYIRQGIQTERGKELRDDVQRSNDRVSLLKALGI